MNGNEIQLELDKINHYLHTSNCSDFRLNRFDGSRLSLIGSFDLCYYHEIELIFHEVFQINMEVYFDLDSDTAMFQANYQGEGLYKISVTDNAGQEQSMICEGVTCIIEQIIYHLNHKPKP